MTEATRIELIGVPSLHPSLFPSPHATRGGEGLGVGGASANSEQERVRKCPPPRRRADARRRPSPPLALLAGGRVGARSAEARAQPGQDIFGVKAEEALLVRP